MNTKQCEHGCCKESCYYCNHPILKIEKFETTVKCICGKKASHGLVMDGIIWPRCNGCVLRLKKSGVLERLAQYYVQMRVELVVWDCILEDAYNAKR
jgi:hypothetical protein